jgi:hypothetical protein
MRGYGGNMLQLLPNAMSAFRIANDTATHKEDLYDLLSFTHLADTLRPF